MSWKVPIPVNIHDDFGDDKVAGTLFLVLLLRARNEPSVSQLSRGYIKLERGQLVCGAEELSHYFKDHNASYPSRQTVARVLERLSKIHQKVDIKTTSIGTVVTIKNYDEITKMDNKWTTSGQQVDTNKNVKSVKNDKSVLNTNVVPVPTKRVSRCPLEEPGKDAHLLALVSQNPNGHRECLEYINSVSEDKGHKFINYPKQILFVHRILRAGFNFDQIDEAVGHLEKDRFYQEKGWDFANLAQYLERR